MQSENPTPGAATPADDYAADAGLSAELEQLRAALGNLREEALRERVRLAVRRTATRWTGKKPVVDVLLIRA